MIAERVKMITSASGKFVRKTFGITTLKTSWAAFDTSFAEFQSALVSFAMGMFFIHGEEFQGQFDIPVSMLGQMTSASWGLLFLAFGLMQAAARIFMPRERRRVASYLSFTFWVYVSVLCAVHTPTPILTIIPLLLAVTNAVTYYRLATRRREEDVCNPE